MKELLPEADKNIAFDYIIMTLLITALDRDIAFISKSPLKLKAQHVLLMEKVRNRVMDDMANLKTEMRKRGIKVFEMISVNEDFVLYKYIVRGYESEFRCFKAALKIHVEKKLSLYYQLN